ncbi:MAG: hypothetical protein K1X88_20965 [Nannocystaceae bacterium]|nr:hypothetical protein [Nannocystaceae bacterium]
MRAAIASLALLLPVTAACGPRPAAPSTSNPEPAAPAAATAPATDPGASEPATPSEPAAPSLQASTPTLEQIDARNAAATLGKPGSTTREVWGVDGDTYTTSRWPDKGIVLITNSAGDAHSIVCKAPCTWTTAKGVAVGTAATVVEQVYGAQINREESNAELLMVGDMYGGTYFTIDAGKVTEIFHGTNAE